MIKSAAIALLASFLLAGCAAIGPPNLSRDRFDYNIAVSDSWKEQTLLNIVKLRYADMPLFLQVTSIVSGYTLETEVLLIGKVFDGGASPASAELEGSRKYIDRPTITYAPITGKEFNRNFMTPVPPRAVLLMMHAGWPADLLLPLTVEAINGLRARRSGGLGQRIGDEGYYRVVELLGTIQRAGVLGVRIKKRKGEEDATVLTLHRKNVPAEIVAAQGELADLLGIRPDAQEYTVVFAEVARNDTELAMLTRSALSIMLELAGQVTVPPQDVAEGRTVPSLFDTDNAGDDERRLIDIRSGEYKPEDAFVAARYRDQWFWIDDRDFRSKRTFANLMLLFSLTESGGKETLPVLTIPAG